MDAGDIKFGQRVLRTVPDIDAPALRRADALMSARCDLLAEQIRDEYVEKHPEDYRVWFLYARTTWMLGDIDRTKALLARVLAEHPDFSSAKILLASLAIDENRLTEAQTLLAEVARSQPNDLWLFMNQLRLEVILMPTPQTTRTLLEVLENPAFPGSARETAAIYIPMVRLQKPEIVERGYRAQLTFESATPYPMKAMNLASYLIDPRQKFGEARKVLDTVLDSDNYRPHWPRARLLKADSYLMEAAAIDASDLARLEALLRNAGKLLDDDWTVAEYRLSQRPDVLTRMKKHLPQGPVPESTDQYGRTVLCNGVMMLNAPLVTSALQRGGNAKGKCNGSLLVEYLFLMAWGNPPEKIEERKGILRALLDAGASLPKNAALCTDECANHFIPILREFGYAERK